MSRPRRKAFTVIEFLVVLAIIGILIALIAGFIFSPSQPSKNVHYDVMTGTTISLVKLDGHDYFVNSKGGMTHSVSCPNEAHKK